MTNCWGWLVPLAVCVVLGACLWVTGWYRVRPIVNEAAETIKADLDAELERRRADNLDEERMMSEAWAGLEMTPGQHIALHFGGPSDFWRDGDEQWWLWCEEGWRIERLGEHSIRVEFCVPEGMAHAGTIIKVCDITAKSDGGKTWVENDGSNGIPPEAWKPVETKPVD